jgi:hypothetical protein
MAIARLRPHALRLALTAFLAFVSVRGILRATGGEPAVPLDDAFIHFQYARSFWEGRGFAYSPGAEPAAGATSLLWPALLAVPYGFGLRGELVIWAAWALGWTAFAALGYETRRVSERLLSADGALAAELMVLTFGGYVWFAASGMEVVPLAWILMRSARRAAEFSEATAQAPSVRELITLAWLSALMRPEGVIATVSISAVLLVFAPGKRRAFAALAFAGAFLPPLVNLIATGSAATTTASVKWLVMSPYVGREKLITSVTENVRLLFGTLLNGEVWSAVFLPQGWALVFWLAVPALVYTGVERRVRTRALLIAAVAVGMLIPTTYDSFLWNRLRYLWPFAAALFVGVAALADGIGALAARLAGEPWARVRLLASGLVVGGFVTHLSWTLDDLATSANAIRAQQAELGKWARDALPANAVIGVNDTGAIAYFSGRRTFDVVGLTTRGESRYWVAGAGSRFEHYERLERSRLPTHFIVYPEWFALPALLGTYQTERSVQGATILGGETMRAHVADYTALGSAARPLRSDLEPCHVIDELDVADLESEHVHAYQLLDATAAENVALEQHGAIDGARRNRTLDRFELDLRAGGRLLLRAEAEGEGEVVVRASARELGRQRLEAGTWTEIAFDVPADRQSGTARVEVEFPTAAATTLHYWSCRASTR